ncbi:nuclear pore complex protein Nup98-Nup96 [Cydia pomonella]|uniref:nuclear pore complex protein Nup98-Nup96 n=1 Tax=Cydia pomonella TaxID=82600 RepID=UPI002ADD6A44|nr:nuclear pore complex protein Nup98-Nup96 [Cydia pomonella]
MFQKPTFGANSSGFGSFNAGATTSSPFGGGFKSTTNSAFGAPPAFGAAAQPAAGGGLFGSNNTSSGVFGSTNTSGFGSGGGFGGFGASSSGGGLFGASQPAPLFGAQQQQPFQAKPAGFGFGGTSTSTAGTTPGSTLFGAAPATGGMFGQQPAMGGTLFGNNTGGFGQQQTATGTAHAKYNPVVGTDVVVKSGTSQNINIKHHCITCMKEYENKSLEELRLEDYTAGRKGAQGGGVFGFSQPQENKPLFGGSTFGAPATTSAGVFGGGALGASTTGFGNTSTFSFGGGAQNTTQTNSLFGASKPAFGATSTVGTGLFGATTTQTPTFGTATSTFGGFGTNTATQPSTGLFGAKPATTGFGAPPSSGFGSFGAGGGLFGAKPATQAPTFGQAAPAFGSLNTSGFGTTTSTSGGLFGANNTFGKPATQPTFGFNQPTLGGGLGTNTFQAKPAGPAFGSLGGGSLFQQPQQQNTFKTDGLGGGLGGGMFGNTSSLGGLGGLGTQQTFGTNTSFMGQSGLSAAPQNNVHEQILSLVARPYGDSPLFKDLVPDTSTTAEDALKPTNPAAVAAVLANDANYRVGSSVSRLTVLPRATSHPQVHKSLFDGLEEYDASMDDQLTLKPSRKRLVLRPKNTATPEPETQNRSLDEQNHRDVPTQTEKERMDVNSNDDPDGRRNLSNNNNIVFSSEKRVSGSPKAPWTDKDRHSEEEPTSRLYPDLDKELPAQFAERRSSWLTTKPLRKSLPSAAETSAEHSVRELGVRSERDKENIDSLSVSEEESMTREPPPAAPHPAGVKLTRPGYYTIPSLEEMVAYMRPDGSCVVPHLTIGRKNYGNVFYDCEVDVANLDLDALVHFLNKEVIVYPEDSDKPPVGQGLNRRAVVTLDRIWPRDKTEKTPITDPERLLTMDYEGKLRRVCDKHDTKFIEYRPQTGSWVFRVEHFSKYGLTDSDEEDDPTPTVLKRQLVNESLQKNAAPAQIPPVSAASGLGGVGPGLGGLSSLAGPGLGGLGLSGPGLSGLGAPGLGDDSLYAMQHTSLDLLGQAGKAFDMDTTEDNGEPQSLYDSTRGFGVKSPTAELARLENRQSHHVQLMKASIYADDMELDDGTSTSTGDQQVPAPRSVFRLAPRDNLPPVAEETGALVHLPDISSGVDLPMQPLIVNPEKIVLKYHRKVMPFKLTIAGKLDAACIADLSVCRARHSRVGFGPGGAMVFPSTYDALVDLPRAAQLSEIGKYVAGRAEDDWSESVVARVAIGHTDTTNNFMSTLTKQMETLLEWSTCVPAEGAEGAEGPGCPRRALRGAPRERRAALRALRERAAPDRDRRAEFGVSGAYCYEVWTLCEALWGADLDNDGVPGTDDLSIVNRHRELLRWLTEAVAAITDRELERPCKPEAEDESDGHSARVWTLLLGGRLLEACKVSRDHGDLHMASLIAQAAGDGVFRSLIARQLAQWRECGAEGGLAAARRACLRLLAGLPAPPARLMEADWLQALHATARYICAAVPSLEHVIRTYESFFVPDAEAEADLTVVLDDQAELKCPLPPYMGEYDVTVHDNGKQRRVLDLRYELLRARAFNHRPKLHPASYTPDPTDYSLSFLLGVWFGSPSVESITGVAEQLEAAGAWHLAVQALAYHPNDAARGHLIRGVLARHAPARAATPELRARLQLLDTLRVPRRWLLLAQAHRAKYEVRQSSITPELRARLQLLDTLRVPRRWLLLAQAHRAKYEVRQSSITPELRARLQLLDTLRVPRRWLLLAQAHRAKYEVRQSSITPELRARLQLLDTLRVPRRWLLLAQAHRAKYEVRQSSITPELRARLQLLDTLRVPRRWLLLAQAHRAKYEVRQSSITPELRARLQLLDTLRVPRRWLLLAQAHRAKYEVRQSSITPELRARLQLLDTLRVPRRWLLLAQAHRAKYEVRQSSITPELRARLQLLDTLRVPRRWLLLAQAHRAKYEVRQSSITPELRARLQLLDTLRVPRRWLLLAQAHRAKYEVRQSSITPELRARLQLLDTLRVPRRWLLLAQAHRAKYEVRQSSITPELRARLQLLDTLRVPRRWLLLAQAHRAKYEVRQSSITPELRARLQLLDTLRVPRRWLLLAQAHRAKYEVRQSSITPELRARLQLLDTLRVPRRWLLLAQAHRAKYEVRQSSITPELRARLQLLDTLRVPRRWLLLAQAHRAKYEVRQSSITPELRARLQLLDTLRVPRRWLLLAQAHRAKYEVRQSSITPELRARLQLLDTLRVPRRWLLLAQAHRAKYEVRQSSITPELRARLQLLDTLRVPRRWLLLAQAHRAKYEHLPAVEAEHLVGAEQWNAAHKVLLEELLPEAVLADDLRSIAPLLEQLNEAAERHEVSGWQHGGQALHHYIRVCDEIRSLVSCMEADRESVQTRLEALRPRVAAACRAQAGLAVKTPRHCAARAEMGARLLQLAVAAREPPAHLAALLAALPLPPDCTATARQKVLLSLCLLSLSVCKTRQQIQSLSVAPPPTAPPPPDRRSRWSSPSRRQKCAWSRQTRLHTGRRYRRKRAIPSTGVRRDG